MSTRLRFPSTLRWTWLGLAALAACLVLAVWSSDMITLDGERTVYTVGCEGGIWQGAHCSGRLVAEDRFHYRALKGESTVTSWRLDDPAGPLTLGGCVIRDGRNWRCESTTDPARTITLSMTRGEAEPSDLAKAHAFHVVAKWRWWLLRWHIAWGSDANR